MLRLKEFKKVKQKISTITHEDIEKYISKFQNFINKEYEEEKKQLTEQLTNYSKERLIEEGMTLFDLKGKFDGHFFSNIIVKFTEMNHSKLSNHHFNSGDSISLSIKNPLKDQLLTGTVIGFNQKSIRILLNIENWTYNSILFRIDKSINQTTLNKMTEALTAIQFKPNERKIENAHLPIGSYLSKILLGDVDSMAPSYLFEPNRNYVSIWKQSMTGILNASQINSILNSMDKQYGIFKF